jgi:hypothetical protein
MTHFECEITQFGADITMEIGTTTILFRLCEWELADFADLADSVAKCGDNECIAYAEDLTFEYSDELVIALGQDPRIVMRLAVEYEIRREFAKVSRILRESMDSQLDS